MLFGRRGARTAVARAFVWCVLVLATGERMGTPAGWIAVCEFGQARGKGMLLIIGAVRYYSTCGTIVSPGLQQQQQARQSTGSHWLENAGLRMQSSLIDSIAGMNTISGEPFRSLESRLARVVSSGLLVCWEYNKREHTTASLRYILPPTRIL
jgi:hypothetical protein